MQEDAIVARASRQPAGPVRLVLDASRCDRHGMCSVVCPERISLDPWGFAVVDPALITRRSTLRKASRAARCCPERALSVAPAEPASHPDPG